MDSGRRAGRKGCDYGSEGWGFDSLRARSLLIDLLTFQQARRAERRDSLAALAREARDLETYEKTSEDYEAALAEARQKLA
jgi:hypothetical protein